MGKDIFISYSRKDSETANRICKALDRAKISYFIDWQGIGGAMEFPEILANAIIDCKLFLFLASNNSYESKFTKSEITFAFNEKPKNTILPYIIDDSKLPPAMRLVFSNITWRNINEHPIDTILINDLLSLLKDQNPPKEKKVNKPETKTIESGIELYNSRRFVEALPLLEVAANQNDAKSQYCLAVIYADGYGVKKDLSKAIKWFRKSAEQNYDKALFRMAKLYQDGDGVPQDDKAALKLFLKAAEQGHILAAYKLGIIYEKGLGVYKDETTATSWYEKAALKGYDKAQTEIGYRYLKGIGITKDYNKALEWFRKASLQNCCSAKNNIGFIYFKGLGVKQDYSTAIWWFRQSAMQNYDAAQYNLGYMYQHGLGVKQDIDTAIKWYTKAADQGYEQATDKLKELKKQ